MKIYKPSNTQYKVHKIFQSLYYAGLVAILVDVLIKQAGYFYRSYSNLLVIAFALLTIFAVQKSYNIKRMYLITVYKDYINLQYYKGLFYFTERLVNIDLYIKDIKKTSYNRMATGGASFIGFSHILVFEMNDGTVHMINVLWDSSLKEISSELNKLIKN